MSKSDGTIIDEITYPKLFADESFGRSLDGSQLLIFTDPTPGAANESQGFASRSDTPELNVTGGFMSSPFSCI